MKFVPRDLRKRNMLQKNQCLHPRKGLEGSELDLAAKHITKLFLLESSVENIHACVPVEILFHRGLHWAEVSSTCSGPDCEGSNQQKVLWNDNLLKALLPWTLQTVPCSPGSASV